MSVSANVKEDDLLYWNRYKKSGSPEDRSALLGRVAPLIQSTVTKWAGPVPRDVLTNEAKILAAKAFDTYDPTKGTELSTHVVNNLAPISRVVYTHQNTVRMPENIVLKVHSYTAAKEHLTATNGREPTADELHQELGWSVNEINRVSSSLRKDLVESVGGIDASFFGNTEDEEEDTLLAIFMELTPDEKRLFEYTTGFNGAQKLGNPQIRKLTGWTQAQLSYKKTMLKNKLAQVKMRTHYAR